MRCEMWQHVCWRDRIVDTLLTRSPSSTLHRRHLPVGRLAVSPRWRRRLERQGAERAVISDGYFSDMSWVDWVGVVLFAPLLLALTLLLGYVIVGIIGSGPRRRRIAQQAAAEPEATDEARPKRTPRQAPGD